MGRDGVEGKEDGQAEQEATEKVEAVTVGEQLVSILALRFVLGRVMRQKQMGREGWKADAMHERAVNVKGAMIFISNSLVGNVSSATSSSPSSSPFCS